MSLFVVFPFIYKRKSKPKLKLNSTRSLNLLNKCSYYLDYSFNQYLKFLIFITINSKLTLSKFPKICLLCMPLEPFVCVISLMIPSCDLS